MKLSSNVVHTTAIALPSANARTAPQATVENSLQSYFSEDSNGIVCAALPPPLTELSTFLNDEVGCNLSLAERYKHLTLPDGIYLNSPRSINGNILHFRFSPTEFSLSNQFDDNAEEFKFELSVVSHVLVEWIKYLKTRRESSN